MGNISSKKTKRQGRRQSRRIHIQIASVPDVIYIPAMSSQVSPYAIMPGRNVEAGVPIPAPSITLTQVDSEHTFTVTPTASIATFTAPSSSSLTTPPKTPPCHPECADYIESLRLISQFGLNVSLSLEDICAHRGSFDALTKKLLSESEEAFVKRMELENQIAFENEPMLPGEVFWAEWLGCVVPRKSRNMSMERTLRRGSLLTQCINEADEE